MKGVCCQEFGEGFLAVIVIEDKRKCIHSKSGCYE